ncbi:MAG: polysaccharide deacetylase family protein [Candidatus Bathyarchaeia archaeon]
MSFWPNGYKCCVFLSFDYDSSSATMWRTPLDVVTQSRGRYAPKVAIPRILDLLERLGIKATFFTPGWTIDNYPDSVEEIRSRGHEIGGHGYAHERMTEISYEAEESVFERMMISMEHIGVKPEGYRAPYWLVSDRTIMHLKRLGFKYSSNFMDDDMPYMLKYRGEETGLVELPVEWILDDWPQFDTERRSPAEVYEIWKPEFEGLYELGRYFCLTCHPQAIGRISRLKMLEKLLREMQEKKDVWFATGAEIAEWVKKKLA